MKRPAHLTLVDADKFSALVSRCTELRERAEKAEARIEALESDKAAMRLDIVTIIGMYGDHMHPRAKQALEALAVAYPNAALAAEEETPLCDCLPGHLCELRADGEKNDPETFCPACDAGVGQCNGPHKGNAGEVPY